MRRREFITFLGGATAWPLTARAQQPEQNSPDRRTHAVPRERSAGNRSWAKVFRREFEKLGWNVSGNLQINFYWGTGDADWVRAAAARLLSEKPDVMLANGDASVTAAQQLTRTVPVIFIGGGDPVADGWVQSSAIPAAT